jgi:multiple sugar transport system permease protein
MSAASGESRDLAGLDPLARMRALGISRWLYVLPALIAITGVLGVPIAYALHLSFDRKILDEPALHGFAGLHNYTAFLGEGLFWTSVENTVLLSVGAVVVQFVLGFAIALCLARPNLRGRNTYLSILLVPMLMPYVAGGLIWLMLLNPTQGIVNYLLGLVGGPTPAWLASPTLARITIILVDSWHNTAWTVFILLSGLLMLPQESLQAASIDGAGKFRTFFHITLPLMKPVILVALIIRLIASLMTFDLIYVMTGGGPGSATETLSFYIYRLGFKDLNIGEAAAASIVFLAVVIALVVLLMRMLPDPTASTEAPA